MTLTIAITMTMNIAINIATNIIKYLNIKNVRQLNLMGTTKYT